MPYYAVQSGTVFRCVVADDPTSACVIAVTQHINDKSRVNERCNPAKIFEVAEQGKPAGNNTLILAEHVAQAGGFTCSKS